MSENYGKGKTFTWIAKDELGVPRCYGRGPTTHIAMAELQLAMREYKKHRPDISFKDFEKKVTEDDNN